MPKLVAICEELILKYSHKWHLPHNFLKQIIEGPFLIRPMWAVLLSYARGFPP